MNTECISIKQIKDRMNDISNKISNINNLNDYNKEYPALNKELKEIESILDKKYTYILDLIKQLDDNINNDESDQDKLAKTDLNTIINDIEKIYNDIVDNDNIDRIQEYINLKKIYNYIYSNKQINIK